VFCPRCGAESDPDAQYCSACGAPLPGKAAAKPRDARSFGQRARDVAGTTRTQRLLTVGTGLAVLAAIVAFLALPASDKAHPIPQDDYTRALDAFCVQSKDEIAASQRRSLAKRGLASVARNADEIVVITAQWRSALLKNTAPSDRLDRVEALEHALRQVELQAGALSRIARRGSQPETIRQAANVDRASAEVERSIAALSLPRCAGLKVRLGAVVKR
jgi:hypothetical protein